MQSQPKPTIAHLLPWAGLGGVEIATARIIEATRHRFHHIAFVLEEATQELRDTLVQTAAEIIPYTAPTFSLRHADRFYHESRIIADHLSRLNVDLIHFSEIKAGFHNALAGFLARRPMLCHVRSRFPELLLRDRICLSSVDRFLFVSKDSRRQFAMAVPDRKARIVYDAVDVIDPQSPEENARVRAELGIPQDGSLIGMVARVNPQKDYDTLASAAATVLARHPGARFLIVGDNSEVELNRMHFAYVQAVLNRLGILNKFTFTGLRKDVPRLISAMDLFVLSTHREGLPLSILEAMSMGKPIVATAVDGIPEVLTEGVTGMMHKHGDSQGLSNAILSCIGNPDRARAMGLAARDHCRNAFSRARFADDMERVYREMLRGRTLQGGTWNTVSSQTAPQRSPDPR